MPQNIYDDPDFFEGYSQFRRSREGLAGSPEWGALKNMLPPMKGLRVLDLGCGFGAFARWAREERAESVLGVDISRRMLDEARARTQGSLITFRKAEIENLDLLDASFDLVYSSLALHYIKDFGAVCAMVRKTIATEGTFVFSVEHPIYTAPSNPEWQTDSDGTNVWPLNNYLIEGKRVTDWIASGVAKYHRTISSYVSHLIGNGFQLTHLEEWGPSQEQIEEFPEWAVETHRPLFLLVGTQSQPMNA